MGNNNGFGTANLEPPKFEGYKILKLKTPDTHKGEEKTELVVRLLPPMKSYADSGEWKFYYGQHFGHYGVNTRNPDKPRARPFGCIQKKNKAKEVLVECPKCDQIESMRKKKEAREVELTKANSGLADNALSDLMRNDSVLKNVNEWLFKHSCQKQYWINVMTPSGDFAVLQLSYTTVKDKLEPYLKELRNDMKIDAFDPSSGVWLKFTRTGMRPRVTDSVSCDMEIVKLPSGAQAQVPKAAPLDDAQIERALKVCPDLSKDVVKILSFEQIARLVKCDDSPETVDSIWGDVKEAVHSDPEAEDDSEEVTAAPAPAVVATVTAQPTLAEDDEEAKLMAQMAALKERKAKEAAKASTPPKVAASQTAPEDFLAQFSAK